MIRLLESGIVHVVLICLGRCRSIKGLVIVLVGLDEISGVAPRKAAAGTPLLPVLVLAHATDPLDKLQQ